MVSRSTLVLSSGAQTLTGSDGIHKPCPDFGHGSLEGRHAGGRGKASGGTCCWFLTSVTAFFSRQSTVLGGAVAA